MRLVRNHHVADIRKQNVDLVSLARSESGRRRGLLLLCRGPMSRVKCIVALCGHRLISMYGPAD